MTDFDLPPIMSSRSTIHAMASKIGVLLNVQINTLICEARQTSISVTQLSTWVHGTYGREIMSARTSPSQTTLYLGT